MTTNKMIITLPEKDHLVKTMVFPVAMYGCESWTIKKAEGQRVNVFKLWCWRLLRVPWTARRSNQSILKEINPEYSLEGLILKLKHKSFSHQTYWERPRWWERLREGGDGDDRGDLCMITDWTWVWINSGRWWRTGKPDVLPSTG